MPKTKAKKYRKLQKYTYIDIEFPIIAQILSFWHHPVKMSEPRDWIKLFGRKKGLALQIYTRIEFDYLPFTMLYPVEITSITAENRIEDIKIRLTDWHKLRELHITDFQNSPETTTLENHKQIVSECVNWKNLQAFSLKTHLMKEMCQDIVQLAQLTSLCIEMITKETDYAKEFFDNIHKLSRLRSLSLTLFPPNGNFTLPASLTHLRLSYREPSTEFSINNLPNLRSVFVTQDYPTTEDFGETVEKLLRCFTADSLHTVGITFINIKNFSRLLTPEIMPTSVKSCRLAYTKPRESQTDWFKEGQVQFRSIEISVDHSRMMEKILSQIKHQKAVEELSFAKLELNYGRYVRILNLPQLKLLRIHSGTDESHILTNVTSQTRIELANKGLTII
jgi:hypothetical protein